MYSKILERLADEVTQRDAEGIARAFGVLAANGSIAPGEKLPTIRAVASELGVSSATVAEAWTQMKDHRLISTDRRRGTTLRFAPRMGRYRYWRVPVAPGTLSLDLSTGTPDPLLLPRIEPILEKLHSGLEVMSYLDPPVLPALGEELGNRWPYDPPALAVFDGANDGLDRVIQSVVRLGEPVIVEDPTYPLLLDLLDLAGAETIGVPLDGEGPDLEAVRLAMQRKPVAMIIQTGAHNPTGAMLSQRRADELAQLIGTTNTVLIEDNHALSSASVKPVTAGATLPDQVYHIHSFSKSHGPDLRIAAMSGPAEAINEVEQRRQIGPGWTSRLLQRVLLEMLRSPEVEAQVERAASQYQHRRDSLSMALSERGVTVGPSHGLNLWVPVQREQLATVGLAAQGIGVSPGEPFRVRPAPEHLRVTSAYVRDDFDRVADAIASAASTAGFH